MSRTGEAIINLDKVPYLYDKETRTFLIQRAAIQEAAIIELENEYGRFFILYNPKTETSKAMKLEGPKYIDAEEILGHVYKQVEESENSVTLVIIEQ